ncbi:uncharacterized protein LOC116211300 [Punica granatum]|uniref:Uncharacterized protein n=2 Tax=Punica granatum TaxID=22663 RepID=A0A2I0K7D4_PUNGR|nr:uncharacterized protein LOC116211300 [Punica granatum]PKI64454.1 hypothetical protein CRG98_015179 [Punica granatum]
MRTRRMSGDDCHPRACAGKRIPKGCKKYRKNPENVVVIDVDGDDHPDVVIIDVPDSFKHKVRDSAAPRKERKVPYHKVISIDDEDSDVDHPGFTDPGVSELDSDATSSKRSFPSPDISGNHVDSVNQFHNFQAEKSSFKLSKCQKSRTGKAPCRNRYGLSPESEDGLSESDCSDCEVLEGSFEELREQWEKAYSKRRHGSFNCRYGTEDQASTSNFHGGARTNVGVDYRDDFCPGDPISSFSTYNKDAGNLSHDNDDHVDFRERGCSQPDQENACLRSETKEQDQFVPVHGNGEETFRDKDQAHAEHRNSSNNSMDFHCEDQSPKDAYWWFNMEGDKQDDCTGESSEESEERNTGASCPRSPVSANCDDKEPDLNRSQAPGEANVPERVLRDRHDVSNSSSPNETHYERAASYNEELLGDQSVQKSRLSDEIDETNGEIDGDLLRKSSANCDPKESHEAAWGKPEHLVERTCSMKDQDPFVTSTSKTKSNEETGGKGSLITQDSIINGREKLKETDEYRRAQEEEWASRKQQLQLQAEEAQRLRKKRRAETLRMLEMERRQKQRVEEVRKTQKKDEENMNLKEKLRAEIRKELTKLEMSCIDMPSLLRGLGIHVESSSVPLEVHSAYKRALLRFHPDRASRNDIRQQVEAEEKFKLISRMKEKFRLTSCH